MVRTRARRHALVFVVLVSAAGAAFASERERATAFTIVHEMREVAAQHALWPGFDPTEKPLAIYTGAHTWLFHHPAPPDGFRPVPEFELRAFVAAGRHPAVLADSVAEIGGLLTATLMAHEARIEQGLTRLAATAIHEAFHVHQRSAHPDWVVNIIAEFAYPTDDPRRLRLRRLESAKLRSALAAPDEARRRCWARSALALREERFDALGSAGSDYERMIELVEGTAYYVEFLAAGETTVEMPEAGFPPADVRQRASRSGAAFAFLLDGLRPGWQADLTAGDERYLDQMLRSAVARDEPAAGDDCRLTPEETERVERAALADVERLAADRAELRRRFGAQAGWRIVVEASEDEPLLPCGIDPVNIDRLEGGLLHTRRLCLQNANGELDMLDESGAHLGALTEAAGANPLFDGIRRVTIAGLPEPAVDEAAGRVSLRAPGLELRFDTRRIHIDGTSIRIPLRVEE